MTVSQDAPETVLSENVELPRLVDLCAKRLDLNIQYDASQLKGALTLRIGRGVSDAELWVLTNRLLASRGFTSVRLPGEDTLNIVKLAEAAPLARVEAEGLDDTDAGFVKVMVELNHRTPQDVLDPLKLTLTRAAGTATAVGKTRRLLLADLRPNLVQALDLLRLLDVPPAETTIEPIAIRFLSAADLVSQVEKVAASQAAVSGRQRSGKLLASSDGQGVLLVAPGDEISYWRLLIEQLDRGEEREVRTYLPERFALGEVSGLIEEVVLGQDEGARKRWRMISDELTGSLIVTATVSQHQQIQQLLERLEAVPRLEGVMEQVPTRHLDANSLIAMVEKAATVRSTVTEQKLRGKLLPAPDGKKVLVFAPAAETALWLELLAEMDQREALETVSYSPRYFPVDEVGELIEQLAGAQGSTQADSGWRMIQDSLTGTLIVTATRRQHLQIDELMTRLDGATPTARRPFRSFALKNRAAADLVSLLQELISGGALEATTGSDQEGDSVAVQPPLVTPEVSQVTPVPSREVLQPPTSPSSGATALSFEGEELLLTADPETNTLIAIGEARLLEQLEGLIAQLDVRQPQVLIEALVLSLTESDALDLGVEIQRFGTPDDTLVALSQLFGLGSPNPSDPNAVVALANGFTGIVLDPGRFSVLINALQTVNEGRNLSVPRVLVNNNQTAVLDATLQNPYASTNASSTVATTSFGGTLDAGTTVTVTPLIAESDHLVLQYSVSLSQFVGESIDPSLPPPRQQNKLESVVTIPDGYRIALGGLQTDTEGEIVNRIPLLADIPWLGYLFESRSRTITTNKFYVFIGATIFRHGDFQDLRYVSDQHLAEGQLDDGFPDLEPRLIR